LVEDRKLLEEIWSSQRFNFDALKSEAKKAHEEEFSVELSDLIGECKKYALLLNLSEEELHEKVYETFSELIAKETTLLKVGSPYEEDTFMGPLIDEESKNRTKTWIASAQNEGARVIAGGIEIDGIFPPTVMVDVTDDMKIICEEVFAPIVSLVTVPSYEVAVMKMNDSPYGLQFSIFTNDLKMTQAFIEDAQCGGVVINDIPTLRFDVQPYGGSKLSGVGREGPKWALEEFTEVKSVVIC